MVIVHNGSIPPPSELFLSLQLGGHHFSATTFFGPNHILTTSRTLGPVLAQTGLDM